MVFFSNLSCRYIVADTMTEQSARELTQCLQRIDANFASSVQTSCKLLQNAKTFEKQMAKVSASVVSECSQLSWF